MFEKRKILSLSFKRPEEDMNDKILIIDDDAELCELLDEYLEQEGFDIQTTQEADSGLKLALSENYRLIILDVMLPGMNGFDLLRRIRESSFVPVLMLTARGDDVDRIVGLEIGADDYLPKPFNPRELIARIRAILRRYDSRLKESTNSTAAEDAVTVGEVALYRSARSVYVSGEKIALTSVEFILLDCLLDFAGHVLTREELAQKALGRPLSAYDRSIDVHISSLRKKLGPFSNGEERITSVRGVGYQYLRR